MTNKLKDIVITITIPVFIITLMIINILKKDTDVSLTERRKLAKKPELTIKNILDGSFMTSFDKYTTDQFYHRDEFRLLKARIDLTTQNNYHNLYYYEDYIIEQIYPLNISSIASLSKKITNIKNTYLDSSNNIYLSIIPDKNYFVNDNNLKLDYSILTNTLKNNLSYATYIDIFEELSITDYYKTDPHWKEENLLEVANKIINAIENKQISYSYTKEYLTSFTGAYSGRIPNIKSSTDDIYILTNSIISNALVYNYETNTYTSIYDKTKLSGSDLYDVYLSGSVPLITLINNNTNTTKELIIFRDSYTSSLAPLLLPYYSKITLIDTRYISPKILSNYIDFENKDILFIYSTLLINNSVSIK